MTISEAISQADASLRNSVDAAQKISWLNLVDSTVKRMVLDEYSSTDAFTGYTADTPGDTELLMPAPFDVGYVHFLIAQIYLNIKELDQYNNFLGMYYTDMDEYSKWYRRTHNSKTNSRFLF